jgi:NADP-dependent 3-hydroxy acid dehydrogenase YdfG
MGAMELTVLFFIGKAKFFSCFHNKSCYCIFAIFIAVIPLTGNEFHIKGNMMQTKKKTNSETVVLITGASSGIGLAAAKRFLNEGFIVVATARSPESRPELLALAKQYPQLLIKKLDVTDSEESIHTLINSIGIIDILINNAGIGIVGVAESFSQAQIQHIINTNVFGVVNVTNAVLPGMRAQNSGKIITISSVVGPLPDMRQCFYSGSKAMVEHYTAQLKNDLKHAGYNIAVANIHPGPVVTNFETAVDVGERFNVHKNPYPQMHNDIHKWRNLMRAGRPISEPVDTIFKVIGAEQPLFWNPTHSAVHANFADTYCDPSGERFSQGPLL